MIFPPFRRIRHASGFSRRKQTRDAGDYRDGVAGRLIVNGDADCAGVRIEQQHQEQGRHLHAAGRQLPRHPIECFGDLSAAHVELRIERHRRGCAAKLLLDKVDVVRRHMFFLPERCYMRRTEPDLNYKRKVRDGLRMVTAFEKIKDGEARERLIRIVEQAVIEEVCRGLNSL